MNLSAFFGGSRPPASLVNKSSDGTLVEVPSTVSVALHNGKHILSGALEADTLKPLLEITGAGAIKYLALDKIDATSRTIRLKVDIDGVTVFDATSAADADADRGLIAVGTAGGNSYFQPILDHVSFNQSLSVSVASSLTETDKLALITIYEVY